MKPLRYLAYLYYLMVGVALKILIPYGYFYAIVIILAHWIIIPIFMFRSYYVKSKKIEAGDSEKNAETYANEMINFP